MLHKIELFHEVFNLVNNLANPSALVFIIGDGRKRSKRKYNFKHKTSLKEKIYNKLNDISLG